ncbi:MAG TPA: histidine kinase, partial [Longimicrobiaceae bacterium]|nr:histidine kinase [Longimicrobiaceae bacterium]
MFWAFWTVYAALMLAVKYFRMEGAPLPYRAWGSLLTAAWQTGILLAICLAALAVAERFPLGRGRWRNLGVVALSAVGVVLGWFALQRGIWCRFPLGVCSAFPELFTVVPTVCTAYLGLLGLGYALQLARRHGERELSERRMEAQMAEARLAALKMQLHPHFLFNTLQSVSTLMHRDVDAARTVLGLLRDLLAATLEREAQQEVALEQELRVLELYTGIERVRFGDRLGVEVRVDPAAGGALVPHLLLQPLVENAIRHGISCRRGPGRVEVEVAPGDGGLRIVVRDDGAGYTEGRPGSGGGIGLANTRARLAALYGASHRFDIGRAEGGGTRVAITLPLRYANGGEPGGDA